LGAVDFGSASSFGFVLLEVVLVTDIPFFVVTFLPPVLFDGGFPWELAVV